MTSPNPNPYVKGDRARDALYAKYHNLFGLSPIEIKWCTWVHLLTTKPMTSTIINYAKAKSK